MKRFALLVCLVFSSELFAQVPFELPCPTGTQLLESPTYNGSTLKYRAFLCVDPFGFVSSPVFSLSVVTVPGSTPPNMSGPLFVDNSNPRQSLMLITGNAGTTNPPQYVELFLGANTVTPTQTNYTMYADLTDAASNFADVALNAQGGDILLNDRNVTAMSCGERSAGAHPATPNCIIDFNLMVDNLYSFGTLYGISGCSETAASGGGSAGKFLSGTTGTCTVTITPPQNGRSPLAGWSCWGNDLNTGAQFHETAFTTTTVTISGTTTSGDTVVFGCLGF